MSAAKQPRPTVTDLSGYPLVLDIEHIQAIYGRSLDSVEHAIRRGVDLPQPVSRRPMRWLRATVEAHLAGRLRVDEARRFDLRPTGSRRRVS